MKSALLLFTLTTATSLTTAFDLASPATSEEAVNTIHTLQSTWKAHVSPRFTTAILSDVASLCGSTLSTDLGYDDLPEASDAHFLTLTDDKLPENFDSTVDFVGCEDIIGHVRDQSSCGSCWAFGSTEAFNDRRCIAYADHTLYAAEDTLSCCSGIRCGMSRGCGGGQPTSAWRWFTSNGVTTGGDFDSVHTGKTCNPYPFQACAHHVEATDEFPVCPDRDYRTPKCTESCMDERYKTNTYGDDKVMAKTAYSVKGGDERIMREIVSHGPVTAAFTVYDDFPNYKSGVYKHTSKNELGGHAVEIVGFGVEDGVKYWKVKNSWNSSWGDGGFFKILRGSNECGIEGTVSAGAV